MTSTIQGVSWSDPKFKRIIKISSFGRVRIALYVEWIVYVQPLSCHDHKIRVYFLENGSSKFRVN